MCKGITIARGGEGWRSPFGMRSLRGLRVAPVALVVGATLFNAALRVAPQFLTPLTYFGDDVTREESKI